MSAPTAATMPLPAVGSLRPRQQMAMECALCARYLGASGRVLGDVRHRGRPFRLWGCDPGCHSPVAGPFHPPAQQRPEQKGAGT
ncbi:hypothetical protein [Streptomyces sp. TRM68367]|uniref:hypothetical protein n=1 Tax=Streptomyces sp. TRM68367 TaxID=2758415 RepID=UPI00165B6ECE|nr:hypothetical protein [Streptomyces sp. TRM68367]MBC9730345.1 hypothetical protein [Streptomyces sp. TRM68367]